MRGLEPAPPSRRGESEARGVITVPLGPELRDELRRFLAESKYPGSQADYLRALIKRSLQRRKKT